MSREIHNKINLDPADYVYVRSIDNDAAVSLSREIPVGTWGANLAAWSEQVRAAREDNARVAAMVKPYSLYNCTHCGQHIRYANVWRHTSGEYIVTGDQCASERMGLDSRAALDADLLRKSAASRAAAAKLTAAAHAWIAANAELWERMINSRGDSFITNMIQAVARYGNLTERQHEAAIKACDRVSTWTAPGAVCELRDPTTIVMAPEGKAITITGEVIKVESRENAYGIRLVMTVRTDAGWLAWGTVPQSIYDVERGQRITFVADLARASGGDGSMAFTSRPRKAEVITPVMA